MYSFVEPFPNGRPQGPPPIPTSTSAPTRDLAHPHFRILEWNSENISMKNVEMPKMGDTMEEGKILRWIKREGDPVKKGEPMAEVETDKVNIEIEASRVQ